jgi:Asp-tRNA(Asn)/Glu-tRNA(Gln) amidotransferase A subunit family amidase
MIESRNNEVVKRIKHAMATSHEWVAFDEDLVQQHLENRLRNDSTHPLADAVVSVKDNINVAEFRTTFGTSLYQDYFPGNDARVVDSLRKTGCLIAGKVETAEFAVHKPGRARNPTNLELSPGTSSGGSAASVANGSADLSIGTQALGSIIKPASFCGVIGFKPSYGLIPRTGVLRTADSLDTIGFLSTNLDYIKLAFEATRVKGPDYPFSDLLETEPEFESSEVSFVVINQTDAPNRDILAYLNKRIEQMRTLGCAESFIPGIEEDIELSRVQCGDLYAHELFKNIGQEVLDDNLRHVSQELTALVRFGSEVSRRKVEEALRAQAHSTLFMTKAMGPRTILVTLSAIETAPEFGDFDTRPDNNFYWTWAGLPVISLPSMSVSGHDPIGVSFIAARNNDAFLLDFAHRVLADGATLEDSSVKR